MRLEPGDVCFRVIDLVQGFHQVPVHEDSRDLLTIILPQGKYRFTFLPQGLVCSTDFFNLLTEPDKRNEDGFYKNVDDILTAAQYIRQAEEADTNLQKKKHENLSLKVSSRVHCYLWWECH